MRYLQNRHVKSKANFSRPLKELGATVAVILMSVAASFPAAIAQGPPQYELTVLDEENTIWPPEWPPTHNLRPSDVNEMGVVVGRTYDLNHLDNAFMYVHATGRMYDLNHLDNTAEWVDLETNSPTVEWFAQNATGINESNQIVGTATNIDPNVVNRYYVLHDPLGPNPTFQLLSSFGNTDTSFSGRINDHGVVVGKLSGGVIVYDPANNYEPVDTGGTIPPRDINNDGVIVCGGGDVPAQIIEPIGLGYVVHEFPEFQPLAFSGINDLGIVTGFQFETGRGRNKVPGGPIRFDFERYQQNPTTVPELLITAGGYNFNWGGDVNFFGDIYFGHDGRGFLFLEGQGSFPLDDYVLFDTPQEEALWFSNGGALPSGITDNGKLICWSDDKGFLLTPISNEPTPGITVTPTSGLVTTEAVGSNPASV